MPKSSPTARIRVLVVDDDPVQREFSLAHLSGRFDVSTVVSGGAALLAMKQKPFDVVVTDYDMPGMNGIELIKAIRAGTDAPEVGVILLTGSEDLAVMNAAYKLRISTFVSKPVNWQVLPTQIEQAARGTAGAK